MFNYFPVDYRESAEFVSKRVKYNKVYSVSDSDRPWAKELEVYVDPTEETAAIVAVIGHQEDMLDKANELGLGEQPIVFIALFDKTGDNSLVESVFTQGSLWKTDEEQEF